MCVHQVQGARIIFEKKLTIIEKETQTKYERKIEWTLKSHREKKVKSRGQIEKMDRAIRYHERLKEGGVKSWARKEQKRWPQIMVWLCFKAIILILQYI